MHPIVPRFAPVLAIDGLLPVSQYKYNFFSSDGKQAYNWFQLDLAKIYRVGRVVLVSRLLNCCDDKERFLEVSALTYRWNK